MEKTKGKISFLWDIFVFRLVAYLLNMIRAENFRMKYPDIPSNN